MTHNLQIALTQLRAIEAALSGLAPALTALGVPGVAEVARIGAAALAIADEITLAVAQGKAIADATDQEQLAALIDRLLARAEELGAQVDAT